MSGEFFIIKPAVATNETGTAYPQASITLDYSKDRERSYRKMKPFCLPGFIPDFDHFILDEDANFTDLISCSLSYYGLLISYRFAALLENFHLQEYELFDAVIKYFDEGLDYYWLHLGRNNIVNLIDYGASEFYSKVGILRGENLVLRSYEDYWVKLKDLGHFASIYNSKIILKSKPLFDLFVIPFFDGNIYVSSKLKASINEFNLTGINFEKANHLIYPELEN